MTDLTEKLVRLGLLQSKVNDCVRESFPLGADITWRMENSHVERGKVTGHSATRGVLWIRVVDDKNLFNAAIQLADILRAAPWP